MAATAMMVTMGTTSRAVIPTSLDTFRGQDVVQVATTVGERMDPAFHNRKHVSVNLQVVVTQSRVVEDATNVVQYLVYWDLGMIPSINDARSNVRKDSTSNLTSRVI